MTTKSVQSALVEYFQKETSYSVHGDFYKIRFENLFPEDYLAKFSSGPEEDKVKKTVVLALDNLVKLDILAKSDKGDFYALKEQLHLLTQTVILDGFTASKINQLAVIINPRGADTSMECTANNVFIVLEYSERCVTDALNAAQEHKNSVIHNKPKDNAHGKQ